MKYLFSVIFAILMLSGCRDKIICPAFQSTYILDDSVRSVYYSYIWKLDKDTRAKYLEAKIPVSDSVNTTLTPGKQADYYAYLEKYIVPPREVNKTKYGIVRYEPYWMKNYQQRTAPKENLLAPPPVPVETEQKAFEDTGTFVASDFSDSTSLKLDSTAVAATDSVAEEQFVLPTLARAAPKQQKQPVKYLYRYDPKDSLLNVEQEYYNKYFGKLLVDNRQYVQKAVSQKSSEPVKENLSDSSAVQVQGAGVRINFGKKGKKDAAVEEILPDEELDSSEDEGDGF